MELKSGFKQTEVGVIPEDWEVRTMDTFGRIIRGASPRPQGDRRYFGGNIPRLMVEDITRDHHWVTAETDFLTNEGAKMSRYCKRGTLVVVCSGTPTAVGLPARLAIDACIHDGILAFQNIEYNVELDFLFHALAANQSKLHSAATHGGTFVNLTTTGFGQFRIAKPTSLPEQKAIAEALGDVDSLIESLEQLVEKKKNIKQGAMQELLTGKRRLPGFSGEWVERKLGDLAIFAKVGINPAITPDAIFVHFSLPAFDSGAEPIVEFGSQIGSSKLRVPQGAILISKLNPRISRIWAPAHVPDNAICSTEFLPLVPYSHYHRDYLTFIFKSEPFQAQLVLNAVGTTGSHTRIQPNQALQCTFWITVDMKEQIAIAAILSEMDSEISALEEKLFKTRVIKQGMMQELLTGRIRLVQPAVI